MARERYLINAGKETIHDAEAEKKAMNEQKTPRGKWSNFWFYNKKKVIIGVLAAAVITYISVMSAQTVKPDYNVGLLVSTSYPDSVTQALGNEIAKYGKDLNGDGKVAVQVNQYVIAPYPDDTSSGASSAATASSKAASSSASAVSGSLSSASDGMDPQMMLAYQTKFVGDISTGTSVIFLSDDAAFRSQERPDTRIFAYLDGSTPAEDATDYENMRVPFSKTKLNNISLPVSSIYGNSTINSSKLFKGVSISLRTYYGTEMENKQKSYYEASKELFQKLTAASK